MHTETFSFILSYRMLKLPWGFVSCCGRSVCCCFRRMLRSTRCTKAVFRGSSPGCCQRQRNLLIWWRGRIQPRTDSKPCRWESLSAKNYQVFKCVFFIFSCPTGRRRYLQLKQIISTMQHAIHIVLSSTGPSQIIRSFNNPFGLVLLWHHKIVLA